MGVLTVEEAAGKYGKWDAIQNTLNDDSKWDIRYDSGTGEPMALTKGSVDILHVKDTERTRQTLARVVDILNKVVAGRDDHK